MSLYGTEWRELGYGLSKHSTKKKHTCSCSTGGEKCNGAYTEDLFLHKIGPTVSTQFLQEIRRREPPVSRIYRITPSGD
jgi:hypothetical protein